MGVHTNKVNDQLVIDILNDLAIGARSSSLKPEYLKIMHMRFIDKKTLREIGEAYNCSRENIRQIVSLAKRKLGII